MKKLLAVLVVSFVALATQSSPQVIYLQLRTPNTVFYHYGWELWSSPDLKHWTLRQYPVTPGSTIEVQEASQQMFYRLQARMP